VATPLRSLPPSRHNGLSGLALHPQMGLLGVTERHWTLISIENTTKPTVKKTWPVRGVPRHIDLESMAVLPSNKLVFGTESSRRRKTDMILIADWDGASVRIEKKIHVDYKPWGIRPEGNRGFEGICAVSSKLIAVSENIIWQKNERYAPLLVLDQATGKQQHLRVKLTTRKGKLSGIACREQDKKITVFAIERHFEISRVIRFELSGETITPEIAIDFAGHYSPMPNFEGITFDAQKQLILLSDNHYGRIQGPTRLLTVTNF